jgi:large subunit ribosomal protein L30
MSGSAFNAFKTRVPVAWSPRLYITLVRGLPGTRRLHRRTLEAMRLRRCHRTVEHRTTPSLLGMLTQVKRLVVVETEEMYNARKKADEERRAPRPPLVVSHYPPASTPRPAAAEEATAASRG